jgi:hypothetical protein
MEHRRSSSSEKFAIIYRNTRRHLPERRVRDGNICCNETIKTYTYQAVTGYVIRQTTYVTFQLSQFMDVLYTRNMECIRVRGKIPNSSWYCLSPAFLCIFYSRSAADRKASTSGNKLIHRLVGRRILDGKNWYHRQTHTALFPAGTSTL